MSSRGYGIVLLGPDEAACFSSFECGMSLKSELANRKWNPQQKCWVINTSELLHAWKILKKFHPEAKIVDANGKDQPEPAAPKKQKDWWQEEFDRRIKERLEREKAQAQAAAGARSGPGWADLLFEAVPVDLHADVFRALTRVLHPDAGGNATLVQALVEARDRRKSAA